MTTNEAKIDAELIQAQGKAQTFGGYYHPSDASASKAMRPSETLNTILAKLKLIIKTTKDDQKVVFSFIIKS